VKQGEKTRVLSGGGKVSFVIRGWGLRQRSIPRGKGKKKQKNPQTRQKKVPSGKYQQEFILEEGGLSGIINGLIKVWGGGAEKGTLS